MSAAPGSLVWFEAIGPDASSLHAFYREVVGLQLAHSPSMPPGYAVADCDQTGVAGGVGSSPGGGAWLTVYVEVANVDETVAAAVARGSAVRMPPIDLPAAAGQPAVRVAVVTDPAGNAVGLATTTPAA